MAGHPPLRPYDEPPTFDDPVAERAHRKRRCALGYRVFGELRYGQIGDGHVSARDPERTDHFWMLGYGIPFRRATVADLVLVSPDGDVVEGEGDINIAAYNIHFPLLAARPDVVSAAHTHTPYGTPFSAQARMFEPISQESCAFVFDMALFDDEELDVAGTAGGARIADALGDNQLCILRNHGLLTVGTTVDHAVGAFVMAERVAEVHVKAGRDAKPISTEGAKKVAELLSRPNVPWRIFQWVLRDLVPDPTVVD